MAGSPGFMEILLILLTGGGLGPLMGMPPGPRDEALVRCAPANAIVYVEWAERGPGKEGAPGIEGLVADHEVEEFLEKVQTAVLDGIAAETANGPPEEQLLGRALPDLALMAAHRPGCLFLSYEEDNVIAGDTPPAMMMSFAQGLRCAVVINGGEQADKINENLLELTQFLPDGEKRETIDRLELPVPLPGVPVLAHRFNEYFIVAVGDGALDDVIAGLEGTSKGFAENERFQQGFKKVDFKKTGSVSWFDTAQVLKVVTAALQPMGVDVAGVAEMLGLDSLDYVVSATGLTDGQLTTRQLIATDGRTNGLLKLAAGRGITAEDLATVPGDADFVFSMSIDSVGILDEVRKILTMAGEGPAQAFEQELQQMEDETGVSLENDILAGFGDVWTVHNSPIGGGLLFSGVVASVDVRDAEQARAAYNKVLELFKRELPGINDGGFRRRGAEMKSGIFLGRKIDYLHIVGDDDVPFAPAFCLTKGRLYVATHPQGLKSQLRFLNMKKEQTFADRLDTDIKPPKGDLLSFTYWDAQATAKLLYAMVPYFGQIVMSEIESHMGVEIDIFDIPSGRALLPYIGPCYSTTVRTPDGILTTSVSGLPLPIGSTLTTVVPLMGVTVRPVRNFEPVVAPVEADF